MKTLRSDANPNSKTTLDSALQTVKILHVDDEVNLLTTTKQILELQNQFHVESAASVNEAFQKLRKTKFDVILSDYQMPEKNGLMFLTEIRERGSNVPFILFTGKGREEVAIKALNLGADYYINKLGRPETVYPQLSHCILQAVQNRKAEEKLKYKVEFESVLTRISSRFVNPTNFDEALNNSFKDLGEISGASRIWLFMLRENGTIIDGVHEWCAESVTPQIESLRKLSVEQICWGLMQLREGKIIQIPDVSLLPPNATGVKEVLEHKNIKSIIVLPIIGSGELAGFIGFNDVHITGAWNSDDVALLQIVSELIGNSLERKKTEEKLKDSEKKYRLLTENTTDVVYIQDVNLNVTYVTPSVETVAGYSPEELMKLTPDKFMTPESFERGVADFKEAVTLSGKDSDYKIPFKQYEYVKKDGSTFWGELKLRFLHDSEGNLLGTQGTMRDITDRKQTEEKLRESEKEHRLLTENITDVIFILDLNLKTTYVSPSIKNLAGYSPEEIYQLKTKDFMASESFERGATDFAEAISSDAGKPDSEIPLKQYEYIRKDGTRFWGELKTKVLHDSEGCPVGFQGTLRDVTDRKRTEEKLNASEEQYRLLTENITDVVFIQDLDMNITYASPSVAAVTGYTPEEAITVKPKQFLSPKSYENALDIWKKDISRADNLPADHIRLLQYEYVRKDGSTFWGELKVKFLRDSKGNLLGTQGVLRDITDRKKIEGKLKESEEQYRLLTENTTDVIFIQNLDMSIKYVSPSVQALSGYTPEEVIQLGPLGIMTPESFERGLAEIQADLALAAKNRDHETCFRCYEYIRKDGSTGWGEFKPKLLRDYGGNIIAMQGTLRDVTERKKAEDALRQEQEKLESVTSTLKAGLAIISKDYTILWANKFLTDLCGDVHGKTCYDVFNDHNAVCPNCGVKEIFETGKSHVVCEQSVPVPDGKRAWVELTANPIRDEQGNIIAASELSVVVDERKQMECKLREAEKKYRFLFDKAPLSIFLLDLTGRFVEFNDAAHCQLGYSRKEFERMCVADIEVVDSPEEIIARIKKIQKTGKDEFETKHRTKNGEIRDVINAISLIEVDGKPFFYVVKRDITEQKNAESALIETLEKMEITNEKLTVVGKLTRHDVRNKLSVIANNVYLARRQMNNNSDISKYFDSVDLAVDQVDRIFSFAQTYEMLGIEELSYVNIKSCIDEAISLFSGIDGVTFVNDCSGLLVLADSLLTQLFYNLIDDSLKHGQTVSKIRVCCEEVNDQLKLIYEDNGIGIPENEKETIFKEGYGKDSGYGLYLIRKICEAYAWTITETGKSGSGAQFTVTIPKFNKYNKPTYKIS